MGIFCESWYSAFKYLLIPMLAAPQYGFLKLLHLTDDCTISCWTSILSLKGFIRTKPAIDPSVTISTTAPSHHSYQTFGLPFIKNILMFEIQMMLHVITVISLHPSIYKLCRPFHPIRAHSNHNNHNMYCVWQNNGAFL